MDYKNFSKNVLPLLGGKDNILGFTNCMTRFRVEVKDTNLVDINKIKALDGVMGVVKGKQVQIVLGPGHAVRANTAFEEYTGMKSTEYKEDDDEIKDVAGEMKEKVKSKQTTIFQTGLRHIGNIFIPLIPGFVGCGLILAIANIIKTADSNVTKNPWFLLFAAAGGLLGGMLQILVGYNAGKEYGGSPVLGAIAGALIYAPALAGIAKTDTTAAMPLTIPFFNINLTPALGGVLGVILAAYVFAKIEKAIRKIIPAALDLFLVPFITIIIGGIITLFIIMPIAAWIMKGITYLLVDIALKQGGIVGGFILSATFLPLVMLGIHQGLTPIHAQLIKDTGYTVLLPILAMAGAGQVGSSIAVYVKTKNKNLKKIISNGLPIGFLGVGEPLIYGVSLPLFYPFITACLGAGFGGAVIAFATKYIKDVGAITIGPSGAVLIPLIANGMWFWYVLGLVVSYVAGFILTYLFGFKESMTEKLK